MAATNPFPVAFFLGDLLIFIDHIMFIYVHNDAPYVLSEMYSNKQFGVTELVKEIIRFVSNFTHPKQVACGND